MIGYNLDLVLHLCNFEAVAASFPILAVSSNLP
jgi:hypothetical protein